MSSSEEYFKKVFGYNNTNTEKEEIDYEKLKNFMDELIKMKSKTHEKKKEDDGQQKILKLLMQNMILSKQKHKGLTNNKNITEDIIISAMLEQEKLRKAIAQTYYNKNMESLENYEIYKKNKLIKKVEYNKKVEEETQRIMKNTPIFQQPQKIGMC